MDKTARDLILQIAERAVRLAASHGNHRARAVDVSMALTFVHMETPLRLQELYEANEVQFAHDVFGIWKHIDKNTGKLDTVAFRPKFLAHVEDGYGYQSR